MTHHHMQSDLSLPSLALSVSFSVSLFLCLCLSLKLSFFSLARSHSLSYLVVAKPENDGSVAGQTLHLILGLCYHTRFELGSGSIHHIGVPEKIKQR